MDLRATQEVLEVLIELPPPVPAVLVTQEVIEAAIVPAPPSVLVTQEVIEAAAVPVTPVVRVTQEVAEVVLGAPPPDGWIVEAFPRVRWDGIAEDPTHLRGEWKVRSIPRIEWDGTAVDPTNAWIVHTKPRIAWKTGPGTASTECISGDGEAPEPTPTQVAGLGNVAF